MPPRLAAVALALTSLAGCSTTSTPPAPHRPVSQVANARQVAQPWAPAVWPDGKTQAPASGPLLAAHATPQPTWTPYATKPNILMITSDDLSYLELKYMPHVEKLIGEQGVTFSDAIAPTPLCVPARASLMSGQYAHNHGATSIKGPHGGFARFDQHDTLAQALQNAGYDTLMTGKYMNGYGKNGSAHEVPPGWTDWRATVDPSTYHYFTPVIDHDGRLIHYHGYSTNVLSKQADEMLSAPARQSKPWFEWVSYVAPHDGGPDNPARKNWSFRTTVPAPRDDHKYAHLPLPKRGDMFRHGNVPSASPSKRNHIPRSKRHQVVVVHQKRVEAAQSVDRAVASQIRTLKRTGQLANTIIIFGSDNGYATGEHNIVGKLWEYDEIERIPLLMRGPGIPVGTTVDTAITNPDIAATILQAAGATSLRPLDGVGMLPWLTAPTQWRITPVEGYSVQHKPRIYSGIRIGPWTYVRYRRGAEEMYDRANDPYEMHNLVDDPAYSAQLAQMRALTTEYQDCAGDGCPKGFYTPVTGALQPHPRKAGQASSVPKPQVNRPAGRRRI